MGYNKAETAMEDAVRIIENNCKGGSSSYIKECNFNTNSREIRYSTKYCRASINGIMEVGIKNNIQSSLNKHPILSFVDAKKLAQKIDELHVLNGYLNVKENDKWEKFYLMADRQLSIIDKSGIINNKFFKCLPCHNCGIILPKQCIQVDHYMPQNDGEDSQLLKMMRVLNLTELGPTATGKGFQIKNGTVKHINPKGNDMGSYYFKKKTAILDKWMPNAQGRAFLSLAGINQDVFKGIRRVCEDSIVNLVPLCPSCNINKGDDMKPISQKPRYRRNIV